MKKDLRISRPEAQKLKKEREKQVYLNPKDARAAALAQAAKMAKKAKKKEHGKKIFRMRTWKKLIAFVLSHDFADYQDVVTQMYGEIHFGGVDAKDFGTRIFDPELKTLADLPLGLLGEKRCLLPDEMIPETKEALLKLCKRMIVLADKGYAVEVLIERMVDGWPGKAAGIDRLDAHVDRLFAIKAKHPQIYRDLVRGNHHAVLSIFDKSAAPETGTAQAVDSAGAAVDTAMLEKVASALIVQALLWCSHDVQMVIARNAKVYELFGDLLEANRIPVPQNVASLAHEWRVALDALLAEYQNRQANAADTTPFGKPDPLAVGNPLKGSSVIRQLKREIKGSNVGKADFKRFEAKLAETMERLQNWMRQSEQLEEELKSEWDLEAKVPKSFHALWFSGLSNVAASAVPILRYLQAESQLPFVIERMMKNGNTVEAAAELARVRAVITEGDAVEKFTTEALNLLDAYRALVLRDYDHRTKADVGETDRGVNTGLTSLDRAAEFLEICAGLRAPAGKATVGSYLDTLAHLDLVPESRFSAKGDKRNLPAIHLDDGNGVAAADL